MSLLIQNLINFSDSQFNYFLIREFEQVGIIGILALVAFAITYYIYKRDIVFGLVVAALSMYTIMPQIGYAFYPNLSEFLNSYFGSQLLLETASFQLLSFIFLFIIFISFKVNKNKIYIYVNKLLKIHFFFLFFVAFNFLYMLYFATYNWDTLNYTNINNPIFIEEGGIPLFCFSFLVKQSVSVVILLYALVRLNPNSASLVIQSVHCLISLSYVILLSIIYSRVGDKSVPLSISIGILAFELALRRMRSLKSFSIFKIILFFLAVVSLIISINYIREPNRIQLNSIIENILFLDYYAPAHVLFIVMNLQIIDPLLVIKSNASNCLILLKQPYIQELVVDLVNPGVSSRTGSYAFYIFTEGYLLFGWFGCVYNGLVIFAGLAIWRRLYQSNNSFFNVFVLAIVASQSVNVVRSQSCYFIKDLYMVFLPALILQFIATGLYPSVKLKSSSQ